MESKFQALFAFALFFLVSASSQTQAKPCPIVPLFPAIDCPRNLTHVYAAPTWDTCKNKPNGYYKSSSFCYWDANRSKYEGVWDYHMCSGGVMIKHCCSGEPVFQQLSSGQVNYISRYDETTKKCSLAAPP